MDIKEKKMGKKFDLTQVYSVKDLNNLKKQGASSEILSQAYKMIQENNERRKEATLKFRLLDPKKATLEEVQKLIASGADLNTTSKNDRKNTFLMRAMFDKRLDLVEELIKNGADVNIPNDRGETAIMYGVEMGSEKMTSLLINHGADVNWIDMDKESVLMKGLSHKSIVQMLVNAGADVNHKDFNGTSVLMKAVKQRCQESVSFLINHGADINARNNYGESPIKEALINKDISMVGMLIEAGADLSVYKKGIIQAIAIGDERLVKLMIEKGANLNIRWKHKNSPVMYAVHHDKENIASILIDAGVNLNLKNKYKYTLLRQLYRRGNMDMVRYVYRKGGRDFDLERKIYQERMEKAREIRSYDVDKKGKPVNHSLRRVIFGGENKGLNASERFFKIKPYRVLCYSLYNKKERIIDFISRKMGWGQNVR